jgi:hypothetical protein
MSERETLTIPGVEVGLWTRRGRFDAAAAVLADRHYSREVRGSPQVGGPGFLIVLVTPCERGVWISKYHAHNTASARATADGLDAFRCAMFRNEGAGLSSDLIQAAMRITEDEWGEPPKDGWATYVNASAVASPHPGYCFKKAGWTLDRAFHHPALIRLRSLALGDTPDE